MFGAFLCMLKLSLAELDCLLAVGDGLHNNITAISA